MLLITKIVKKIENNALADREQRTALPEVDIRRNICFFLKISDNFYTISMFRKKLCLHKVLVVPNIERIENPN
jgi:hypothetical protein